MKVSHYHRKKKNSKSDMEWKWIQDVQCLKIENRLQLIQSVSTHVPEREYLVYVWDDKDQSERVRRDLSKLVLHVKEKSSYWQRQIFGSWRGFVSDGCLDLEAYGMARCLPLARSPRPTLLPGELSSSQS